MEGEENEGGEERKEKAETKGKGWKEGERSEVELWIEWWGTKAFGG